MYLWSIFPMVNASAKYHFFHHWRKKFYFVMEYIFIIAQKVSAENLIWLKSDLS